MKHNNIPHNNYTKKGNSIADISHNLLYFAEYVVSKYGGFSGNHGDKHFTAIASIGTKKNLEEYKIKAYGKVIDNRLLNLSGAITVTDALGLESNIPPYLINGVERIEVMINNGKDPYILTYDPDINIYYIKSISDDILLAFNEKGEIKYSSEKDFQKYETYIIELSNVLQEQC